MEINVSTIPPHGKRIPLSLSVDWVCRSFEEGAEGKCTTLSGSILLENHQSRITVKVEFESTCVLECGRCLTPVRVQINGNQNLVYVPEVKTPSVNPNTKHANKVHEEIELSEDDMNLGWYEDGRINVEQVFCEAVSLSSPNRVFCSTKGVTRITKGECVSFKGDDEPLVYNPFANLDEM